MRSRWPETLVAAEPVGRTFDWRRRRSRGYVRVEENHDDHSHAGEAKAKAKVNLRAVFFFARIFLKFRLRYELTSSFYSRVQVYPLAILYEEGLVVGCVSRLSSLSSASSWPLWCLERKTQLYLPQILLYLLRQNLGRVGLKIVRPLQHLPYFSHVLELLLHEVLEEEGGG